MQREFPQLNKEKFYIHPQLNKETSHKPLRRPQLNPFWLLNLEAQQRLVERERARLGCQEACGWVSVHTLLLKPRSNSKF